MRLISEIAGRFSLKVDGGSRGKVDLMKEIGHEDGWMNNLILDNGISLFLGNTSTSSSNGAQYGYVHLGTGTSLPNPSQTTLDAWGAQAGFQHKTIGTSFGYDPSGGFGWTRKEITFGANEAVGTWSEIGAGNSSTANSPLFSRALFLDGAGAPTTITKLAGEILTVTYELRRWWNIPEPYVVVYDDDGTPLPVTVTHLEPTSDELAQRGAPQNLGGSDWTVGNTAGQTRLAQPIFGPVTGNSRKFTVTAPLSLDGPISRLVSAANHYGFVPRGMEYGPPNTLAWAIFDPPIPKTTDYSIAFDVEVELKRRGE